jgi:hypothetical protein
MMPVGHRMKQYLLYWYVAETVPASMEKELETEAGAAYKSPPPYPQNLTLRERVALDPPGYEPIHHEGTGVDEEEQAYKTYLVTVEDAIQKLGKNSVMADVVLKGWKGIQDRYAMEAHADSRSPEQIQHGV